MNSYEFICELIIWIHWLYEFIYIWIYEWSYEFIGYMNSDMKKSYEFIGTWIHSDFIYEFVSIWIQVCEFTVSNLNSWIWFHKHDIMIWIHYWKSRRIQYSELMVLHSMVKYGLGISYNELKRIITQISVMISCMNWIYEFTNLISWEILWFRIKNTQKQLNTILLNTCKPYRSFKVSNVLECTSTAVSMARPMSWIILKPKV